jgi:hypothetical protein
MEGNWSPSDKLAIALTCLGAAVALILFIAEKTPLTVGLMIAGITGLFVFPINHFIRQLRWRIRAFAIMLILVVIFGWKSWPKKYVQPAPPPLLTASPSPIIDQKATGSDCSNLVAGSNAQIKCEADREHDEKDKNSH